MPITSPGNDDDTGENHQPTLRKNTAEPVEQTLKQNTKRVDSRHEFGHFESDTVIGTAPSKRCIDTQVERKSRRLFARLIPDKSAPATARAEYDIYKDIPAPARIDRT